MCAMRTTRPKPDVARKDFVAALESGLKVIETFGPEHPRLTLSDVAAGGVEDGG